MVEAKDPVLSNVAAVLAIALRLTRAQLDQWQHSGDMEGLYPFASGAQAYFAL